MARRRKGERVNRRYNRIIDEGQLDRSWTRWTKCFVCRRRFCVNNYEDRKVRVNHLKVLGKVLCPGCKQSLYGPRFVQLYFLAIRTADACDHEDDLIHNGKTCTVCIASRIVAKIEDERGIS
jgi:hypothetical protein